MIISSEMASCTRSAGVSRKSTFSFISREGLKPIVTDLVAERSAASRARCSASVTSLGSPAVFVSVAGGETPVEQLRHKHIRHNKTTIRNKYF